MEKPQKIAHARALRRNNTDAERRLWRFLRNRQLGGYRFRRQVPLGRYIAGFACMEAKVIVELDGGQHVDDTLADGMRTEYLERGGFRVLRFWNDETLLRTDAVLEAILAALRQAIPHPGPPPQAGEGEEPPPLSLYIHIPWCVKKCPYCDFNSHGLRGELPVRDYVAALLADLDGDMRDFGDAVGDREITSVFFGGGTPSLFAPDAIAEILDGASARLKFARDCEITLETNPGTVEHGRFDGYLRADVNRISFGVQSFDDAKLHALGRIHSSAEAEAAVKLAQDAGFDNINLDLMYALPQQSLQGALADVERAIALAPAHISHYQLTLEPNTAFAANPPPLPDDDDAWTMQEACQARLARAGYAQYEVSAYARQDRRCAHNLNYWRFGDYLGIGAGAHGKVSAAAEAGPASGFAIHRRWKVKHPRAYLDSAATAQRIGGDNSVATEQLPFEYMLNALRLIDGVPLGDFAQRTGLALDDIHAPIQQAIARGWLHGDQATLRTTELGQRFLNDVIELFMPD